MLKKFNISISVLIFFILTVGLFYLAVVSGNSEEPKDISVIEIEGNNHLPKNIYYEYANLADKSNYSLLTTGVIRDRYQKHPYVENVTVNYAGNGKVEVKLFEKEFKALVLLEGTQYVVTKDLEILPVLPNSQKLNYPVIRNISGEHELKPLRFADGNDSIKKSFKILTAARLLNPGLFDNLSEIDLRAGKDIVLYFSSVNYPVILGRNNEVAKMVLFEKLWESIGTLKASELLEYVDLRFTKKVYLGVSGDKLDVEEIQS